MGDYATTCEAQGVQTLIHDQLKRPMPISVGRPIASLFT
jgi:hypothetical protein